MKQGRSKQVGIGVSLGLQVLQDTQAVLAFSAPHRAVERVQVGRQVLAGIVVIDRS